MAVVANVIPCGNAAVCCSGGVNANNVYDPSGVSSYLDDALV